MGKNCTKISKYISLILRHKPEVIGIELDRNGWCDIDALIEGINKSGELITRDILESIVINDDKQRYSIDNEKNRIRANQGYSISVDIELELRVPPTVLYHGTVGKFISSIKEQGLVKGQRQYVHLSQYSKTAVTVGKRRGIPIILEIDSKRIHEDDYKFYISSNNVWLCDHIPRAYIQFENE